jgi:hypothetical protein
MYVGNFFFEGKIFFAELILCIINIFFLFIDL